MPDFFQSGAVATLHRLGRPDLRRLEAELAELARETPMALVLPCHVRELGSPAFQHILEQLRKVRYLGQVIVGLDGADREHFRKARSLLGTLPQPTALMWNDGPRLKKLLTGLREAGLESGARGKGRNVWLCLGYALAADQAALVAVHDCDILTYDRELLARLCYPVAHPAFGFDFCKGYYARVSSKLNGRVTRLLVMPVLRALQSIVGPHPFLSCIETFRYPLSGEIALSIDLARRLRVPFDWGLEIGLLAEVFRHSTPRALCQAELCQNYDHKHQALSPRDPDKGLNRMAVDIMSAIFRRMAGEGIKLDRGLFETLQFAYARQAEDVLRAYESDAVMNGLEFPRLDEESAVETFARSIQLAADAYLHDPAAIPVLPDWNHVNVALPGFSASLRQAVAEDARAR